MRRFNWRKFRRKGTRKLASKDERLLSKSVNIIKLELNSKGSIRDVSREVLPEE